MVLVIKVLVMVASSATTGGNVEDHHNSNDDNGALKKFHKACPAPKSRNTEQSGVELDGL